MKRITTWVRPASLAAAAAVFLLASAARAAIDFGQAERIALERVPGQVESIELERGVFEVEVRATSGQKYELDIDAERGTVLRVRHDD
jgi:uncharacterized membrane protein YkoI